MSKKKSPVNKFKKFIVDQIDTYIHNDASSSTLRDILEDFGIDGTVLLEQAVKKVLKSADDNTIIKFYEENCLDC